MKIHILQLFLSYFVPYNISVATEHTTTMMSYYAVALVTQFFCLSLCTFCLFVKIYATTKVKKKDGNVCLEEISKSSVCNDVFFVSCVLCVCVRRLWCFDNVMEKWNNNEMETKRIFYCNTESILSFVRAKVLLLKHAEIIKKYFWFRRFCVHKSTQYYCLLINICFRLTYIKENASQKGPLCVKRKKK